MKVVNVKVKYLRPRGYNNIREWLKNPKHLYIGRANAYVGVESSKWKNPFSTKKYPLKKSLELYEEHVRKTLMNDLPELKKYDELGCWCLGEQEDCHGNVLLKLLKEIE